MQLVHISASNILFLDRVSFCSSSHSSTSNYPPGSTSWILGLHKLLPCQTSDLLFVKSYWHLSSNNFVYYEMSICYEKSFGTL